MFWETDEPILTVKDMYEYAKTNNVPMLSDYGSTSLFTDYDFWQPYRNHYDDYDKIFCRMFMNFYYFNQPKLIEGRSRISDLFIEFQGSVEGHLLMHDTEYTNLYQLEYAMFERNELWADYIITRSDQRSKEIDRIYTSGSRSDTASNTSGQRTDVVTDQVMAFNSSTFVDQAKSTSQKGQELDSSTYGKGQQIDTEDYNESLNVGILESGAKNNPFENLGKFVEFWDGRSFYDKIFKDIAKELLLL